MAFRGVLLKKGADQAAADISAGLNLSFDDVSSEVADTDAFHEGVTNPSRITIPSAVNGERGILTANVSLADFGTLGLLLQIQKNGSTWTETPFASHSATSNGHNATTAWGQISSRAIVLTTGDFYVFRLVGNDNSVTVKAETNFGLAVLDTFAGGYVLAKKASDQTGANYSTPTAIAWDGTDVYDTHSIHSPSSNNTKLIIPSSHNNKWVFVRANILANNVAVNTDQSLVIRRTRSASASLVYDGVGINGTTTGAFEAGARGIHCSTQAIQVQTGDEFEAVYYNADTSVDIIAARSTFGLWVVG